MRVCSTAGFSFSAVFGSVSVTNYPSVPSFLSFRIQCNVNGFLAGKQMIVKKDECNAPGAMTGLRGGTLLSSVHSFLCVRRRV